VPLLEGLTAAEAGGLSRLVDQPTPLLAAVFVAGLFGIGLGYPGQPHVVNRFMAMHSAGDIGRARIIALAWAAVIYTGMVVLGWCGRALLPGLDEHEGVLLALGVDLLPAALGGLISGGVLAAIMSTSDSQLLVASGAVSHDLTRSGGSVALDRAVVLVVGLAAVLLALFVPESIFTRVLFAWQVLGNGFGPLLLVLLWVGPVSAGHRLAAMAGGAGLTIVVSFLPDAPGDAAERLLPFAVALTVACAGATRVPRVSRAG
jgi:sodium/proline symporter